MENNNPEPTNQAISSILAELSECMGQISAPQMENALELLSASTRIFCAGAGRSGMAIRAFAMRLMHLGKKVHVVGNATTPALEADDLLIVGSGSGRTESLKAIASKAKELGARIILVTIDPASPIGKTADCVVEIPAPSPKAEGGAPQESCQPMGSLFEQSLFICLDALVVLLMEKDGITSEEMFKRHANLE